MNGLKNRNEMKWKKLYKTFKAKFITGKRHKEKRTCRDSDYIYKLHGVEDQPPVSVKPMKLK